VANYVLVFKGGGMAETEAEQQAVMAAWGEWYGKLGQAVVDGGNPFGPSKSVASDGTVSDGPFRPDRLRYLAGRQPRRGRRDGQGLPDPLQRRQHRGLRGL
jgi:hypothetical protein